MKESREKEVRRRRGGKSDLVVETMLVCITILIVEADFTTSSDITHQIELGDVRYPIFVALMEYLYTDQVRREEQVNDDAAPSLHFHCYYFHCGTKRDI